MRLTLLASLVLVVMLVCARLAFMPAARSVADGVAATVTPTVKVVIITATPRATPTPTVKVVIITATPRATKTPTITPTPTVKVVIVTATPQPTATPVDTATETETPTP